MGTLSESVRMIEECKIRLSALCGEILATIRLPENQTSKISDLGDLRNAWDKQYKQILRSWEDAEGEKAKRGEGE